VIGTESVELPTTLRRSAPLLVTAFINRCGTIGLSLLPMLLVEKQLSSASASMVMTVVKVALLVGTLAGGWACDRLGMKRSLLISFGLAGLGLGMLPLGDTTVWICAFAVIGQLGQALFYSPARVMVVELVPPAQQQESIGWLKTANNLGNIVSFAIGAICFHWGVLVLMLFDSLTSLAAAGVGAKVLPDLGRKAAKRPEAGGGTWSLFVLCTLAVAGFFFFYELFMVATAAKCRIVYGDEGLRLFSEAMIVNTVLCTGLAVVAAKALRRPAIVFPAGIALVAIGTYLATGVAGKPVIFAGVLIISLGEIAFTALAQFVIIRSTPRTARPGLVYSMSLVVQSLGRIVGATLAFPMVVHADHPLPFLATCAVILVALSIVARPGRAMRL
jgi:predicted MFS family arabinose efflux permease